MSPVACVSACDTSSLKPARDAFEKSARSLILIISSMDGAIMHLASS